MFWWGWGVVVCVCVVLVPAEDAVRSSRAADRSSQRTLRPGHEKIAWPGSPMIALKSNLGLTDRGRTASAAERRGAQTARTPLSFCSPCCLYARPSQTTLSLRSVRFPQPLVPAPGDPPHAQPWRQWCCGPRWPHCGAQRRPPVWVVSRPACKRDGGRLHLQRHRRGRRDLVRIRRSLP